MLGIVFRHNTADNHRKRSQEDDHHRKSPVESDHENDSNDNSDHSIKDGSKATEQTILNVLNIVDEPLDKVAFGGTVDFLDRRIHVGFEKLFPHIGDDLLSDGGSLILKQMPE